jgi:hypothetical protein
MARTFFYENIRIQRYVPNGAESFPPHVDVYNSAAAARFMTVIIYLNAPQGGETVATRTSGNLPAPAAI